MKERPWIWLIVANAVFIVATITLVVIAVRNQQPEVPIAGRTGFQPAGPAGVPPAIERRESAGETPAGTTAGTAVPLAPRHAD